MNLKKSGQQAAILSNPQQERSGMFFGENQNSTESAATSHSTKRENDGFGTPSKGMLDQEQLQNDVQINNHPSSCSLSAQHQGQSTGQMICHISTLRWVII